MFSVILWPSSAPVMHIMSWHLCRRNTHMHKSKTKHNLKCCWIFLNFPDYFNSQVCRCSQAMKNIPSHQKYTNMFTFQTNDKSVTIEVNRRCSFVHLSPSPYASEVTLFGIPCHAGVFILHCKRRMDHSLVLYGLYVWWKKSFSYIDL